VRPPAKPAPLARRIASTARVHRILGFGEKEPLPTQAGMVRDTLKGLRRATRQRQKQAAPLRLGVGMTEGQPAPEGVTIQALLASCGRDLIGLRDAALISLAYDGSLRVSELVATQVGDVRQVADGSGRLVIAHKSHCSRAPTTIAHAIIGLTYCKIRISVALYAKRIRKNCPDCKICRRPK